MKRFVLVLAVGWLAAGAAFADVSKIDRTIAKEPAYRTKPTYALLAFGSKANGRVWLVRDGDTLYVDRNGNGDLTDPGEKVAAEKRPGVDPEEHGYSFNVGVVTVGDREHKGLSVYFTPLRSYANNPTVAKRKELQAAIKKNPKGFAASISVDVKVAGLKGGGLEGRANFSAGPMDLNGLLEFAESPAKAPVVHCGGSLEVSFYGDRPKLRVGRSTDLILVVGTPGAGPGTFASLGYDETIPEQAKPAAEISFAPSSPGAAPVKEKYEIKERC